MATNTDKDKMYGADRNAHPYYNEGENEEPVTGQEATRSTGTPTRANAEATSDPYEVQMNAHHNNGDANTTDTQGGTTTAPTTETTTTETPAEQEEGLGLEYRPQDDTANPNVSTPSGTGATEATPPATGETGNGVDVTPTTEAEDMAGEQPELTQEEIDAAKKKDRRQKRLNTAARIMDTLARVSNYVATTQGAPSAKWSNRNREYDDNNTYLTRLKNQNAQERKDWWNRYSTGAGIDNTKNAFNLSLQNAKAENERKNREQERKDKESEANVNLANEKAAGQRYANSIAPEQHEQEVSKKNAEIKKALAQADQATAGAYKNRQQGNSAGSKVKTFSRYDANGKDIKYTDESEWKKDLVDEADEYGIPLEKVFETTTTKNQDGDEQTTLAVKNVNKAYEELAGELQRLKKRIERGEVEDPRKGDNQGGSNNRNKDTDI